MLAQARFAFEFCAIESCGKCTPCREGLTQLKYLYEEITNGRGEMEHLALMEDLCQAMASASTIALSGDPGAPNRRIESAARRRRRTPTRRNAASRASSDPDSEPVCDAAAFVGQFPERHRFAEGGIRSPVVFCNALWRQAGHAVSPKE